MNSRIDKYLFHNVLYTLPADPPVFLDTDRQLDVTAVEWLINECDVRPVHGEHVDSEIPAKVYFAENAPVAAA